MEECESLFLRGVRDQKRRRELGCQYERFRQVLQLMVDVVWKRYLKYERKEVLKGHLVLEEPTD